MIPKVLYEVDPHNRLIIKERGRASNLKRFREVLYGRFKTDRKNRLCYKFLKPSGSRIPQKIEFSGSYSLDRKHNLIFTLDRWKGQHAGDRLRLKTGIIDADSNRIIFVISSREAKKKESLYTLKLYGRWQADRNNRLVFGVRRKDGKDDNLTLFGAWRIGKNKEIKYGLGRHANSIILKGLWNIGGRHRISYILDRGRGSGFDFTVSAGRISRRKTRAYVNFDIVLALSKRKKIKRSISFLCKWTLMRGKDVLLKISPRGRKPLSLKVTREILGKKGLAYIEGFLKGEERYLGTGLVFNW